MKIHSVELEFYEEKKIEALDMIIRSYCTIYNMCWKLFAENWDNSVNVEFRDVEARLPQTFWLNNPFSDHTIKHVYLDAVRDLLNVRVLYPNKDIKPTSLEFQNIVKISGLIDHITIYERVENLGVYKELFLNEDDIAMFNHNDVEGNIIRMTITRLSRSIYRLMIATVKSCDRCNKK